MRGTIHSLDEATGSGIVKTHASEYPFHDLPEGLRLQPGDEVVFMVRAGIATDVWPPNLPRPFRWKPFLLSLEGRVSRSQYWLRCWLPTRLLIVAYVIVGAELHLSIARSPLTDAVIIAVAASLLWVNVAVEVKRWHDRNKSGLWMLVGLIPVIGPFWVLAECGLLRGDDGANDYGPPACRPEPAVMPE